MRNLADQSAVLRFLDCLGERIRMPARLYVVGGTSAVLLGWRATTIDVDLKAEPEPDGFFEAIAELKEKLSINVETSSPADFLPELPSWRERSQWICRAGEADVFHYDFYSQALAKIERAHPRDLGDIEAMKNSRLVEPGELRRLFLLIEPQLIRFPSVDATILREKVFEWAQ
jgi:hypothetical protein